VSQFGLQPDGTFEKKSIDQIRDDLKTAFEQELGTDIELRPSSPVLQIINATATEIATQWDAAEAAYYASFYEDSFGEQLDKQLALAGFSRRPLRAATGEVVFSRETMASTDYSIPEGTVVTTPRTESRPPIPFETMTQRILSDGSVSVTVPIKALSPWQTDLDEEWLGEETNVDADTITRFGDPVSGIDSVTNPNPTGDQSEGYVEGRDEERDPEFKLRYETTKGEGGVSTVSAMESSILNYSDDIISVRVEERRDTVTNEYGPEVTVQAPGVADTTIAQAIFESRGAGLQTFGATTADAVDNDGVIRPESFDRATEVDIDIDLTITTGATFPSDGVEQIEDRIIQYIGGIVNGGIEYPGLEIGDDVIFDQVFRRVMDQRGVVEGDMTMAIDGDSLAASNITIGLNEVAMTSTALIGVTTQ